MRFPIAPVPSFPAFTISIGGALPLGFGRPRPALSRMRVKEPKRVIVPLSVDEVARFWSSFRTSRDLAIVGLMLLQGLRSREVIALNREDVLAVRSRRCACAARAIRSASAVGSRDLQLLDHYLRLERPSTAIRLCCSFP